MFPSKEETEFHTKVVRELLTVLSHECVDSIDEVEMRNDKAGNVHIEFPAGESVIPRP